MFLFCSHHLEGKNVTLCRRCHPEGHFLLSHTVSQQKASLKLCAAQVTKRNFFLPAEVLPPSLERLVTGVFWPNAGKCQNSQTSGVLDELKSKLHARVCRPHVLAQHLGRQATHVFAPAEEDSEVYNIWVLQQSYKKLHPDVCQKAFFHFATCFRKRCTKSYISCAGYRQNIKLGHENIELFGAAICETSALYQSKVLGYLWTSSLDYNYVSQKQLSTQNVLVSRYIWAPKNLLSLSNTYNALNAAIGLWPQAHFTILYPMLGKSLD